MPNNGGTRPGAGRKPLHGERMEPKTVRLTRADIAALKAIDPNISAAIRALIARHGANQ